MQASTSFSTFVALGDSFTEGLDDRAWTADGRPSGTYRGWADRVADALAAENPDFRYANLAIRGRRLRSIAGEQVDAAARMGPDLVTLAGGGNDILAPRCDPRQLAAWFDDAVRRLAATGATVVVFAGFDPSDRLPFGARLAGLAARYNAAIRASATAHRAVLVDLWAMPVLSDDRMWSPDRLHLSSESHRRVAWATLEALGRDAGGESRALLEPLEATPWLAARRSDVRWAAQDLAPWIGRRLTHRSSGDGVEPKYPQPVRWAEQASRVMREVG